jgi:hypothetical protein
MNHWMKELAQHYEASRKKHPDDRLMVLFDIDGTILDMRYMLLYLLKSFDQEQSSALFSDVKLEDINMHENQVADFLKRRRIPEDKQKHFLAWYEENRWVPSAVLQSHRPYQGVLEVIRWFQIQPKTVVGLNTGRPEFLREDTLRSLNTLGKEFRVRFESDLLYMNPSDWDQDVTKAKRAGIEHFRRKGYRIIAFIDNEPANLQAVAEVDPGPEILLLHADTLFESPVQRRPLRSVPGKDYDLIELIEEKNLPQHVQLVWNGIQEIPNLRQFLGSNITWGKTAVDRMNLGQLDQILPQIKKYEKGIKIEIKNSEAVDPLIDYLEKYRLRDSELWFSSPLQQNVEENIRLLQAAHPRAVFQCSLDFLLPILQTEPKEAKKSLDHLIHRGINRFGLSWKGEETRRALLMLQEWNLEIDVEGVSNLASFLQAALLLPRSITADFNFPEWYYYGHGADLSFLPHRSL